MKWIAIGLLIGNVILIGVQLNRHLNEQSAAVRDLPPLPPKTPSLRLVSELSELPVQRTKTLSIDFDPGADIAVEAVDLSTELYSFEDPSDTCIEAGPFADREELENFKNSLRTRATTVHSRVETVSERQYFWIYLEAVSDALAKESLNDLERRGVTDYMLVRRGGLKNAISLGLFRSQDSVNRRLAELNRQGYKPVVVPKFESTENYYVRATMAIGSEDTSTVSGALRGDAKIETFDCNDISAAAVIHGPGTERTGQSTDQ